MVRWRLLTPALLAGTVLLCSGPAEARFEGGGGGGGFRGGGGSFGGGGGGFRGGGGGGGDAYRFSAPRIESAPIERSAPAVPRISEGGGGVFMAVAVAATG